MHGAHIRTNTLVQNIMRHRYFWLTMQEDSKEIVWACPQCQIHSNNHHVSQNEYHSITSLIPFAQWGMNLLGPFPRAQGGKEYLVVVVDYFT